jgi:tetratricopeptide (TPR) repeat protein
MIRRSHALAFTLVALALVPLAPRDARAADRSAALDALYRSDAQARADLGTWAAELAAAFAADPESPWASEVLRAVESTLAHAKDPAVVERHLEAAFSKGVKDGDTDEALRDVLERRARARGDFAKADGLGGSKGYLRRLAVIGPFGRADASFLHRRYAPEDVALDLGAELRGVTGPVRWVALPVAGSSAWVNPQDQLRKGGSGVVYALGRLRADAARTVAVKAWCSDSFKIVVNGRDVIVADRERDHVPDAVWGTARLEAGWNRVLVKVAGSSQFALKVADPASGRPAEGVEVGDPLGGTERPEPSAEASPRTYRTPYERAKAATDVSPGSADAVALSATALLAENDDGLPWDAYVLHRRAIASVGALSGVPAARVRSVFARFLENFWPYPEVMGRLEARKLYADAVAAHPGYIPARVRLADHQDRDDHPDKALEELNKALEEAPTASTAMAVARLARKRVWEKESIAAAMRALELSPRLVEAIDFLEDVDRRFADGAALEASATRRLQIDAADGEAIGAKVATLRARGRLEEVLALQREMAKRYPPGRGWREAAAGTLKDLGRLDEALAEWRALEAEVPQEDAYPLQAAQILESKGDAAGAVEAYRRSLAKRPYQPSVWRAISRLEGTPEDFAAPHEPDVAAILAALPSDEDLKKKHPKAIAITVLDHCVTKVRPDGSSSSYVHMIYKVLDEKGVEKYDSLPNQGETLEVRAILPDGRVMLPTGLGGGPFNIEGLVPGTILEQRWLQHEGPDPRGYSGDKFLFQDHGFSQEPNAVLLSRLVVIAPESMKLEPRRHKMEPVVPVTKDGWTTTVWERRDMPRIEPEQNMPDADEIVPWVDYSLKPEFEDAVFDALSGRGDWRPTPILAEAVDKVLAGKEGQTDLEKLHALYAFVNETVLGEIGGGRGATETLLRKSGDRGQLFLALVRTAGIPFRIGRAIPWNGQGQDLAEEGMQAFRLGFLWMEPKGSEPFPFLMGARHAPFGYLSEGYRGTPALVVSEAGGEILQLPSGGSTSDAEVRFEVTVGADPAQATAKGSIVYPDAWRQKQTVLDMTQDNRKKSAENQFRNYLATPALTAFEFPHVADRGIPYEIRLEGTMTTYVAPQGDRFVVSLGLPPSNMGSRFVERPERTYDFVSEARQDLIEEIGIRLGDAWTVLSVPEDHLASSKIGVYSLTYRRDGDSIRIRRERHLKPGRYTPEEFKAFVVWCQKIDEAEERKIELKKRT